MGPSEQEHSLIGVYCCYPFVMLIRMARFLLAQTLHFSATGNIPFFKTLVIELLHWIKYLAPFVGIILFGCVGWFLTPFAYLLAPFMMDFKPVGNRRFVRHLKNKPDDFSPVSSHDTRKMCVSSYMVHADWVYLFCRSVK